MQQRPILRSLLLLMCSLFFTSLTLAETATQDPVENPLANIEWKKITVKQDDSLTRIFLREGLTETDVYRVTHTQPRPTALSKLKAGQSIHLALMQSSDTLILQKLRLAPDSNSPHSLEVTLPKRTVSDKAAPPKPNKTIPAPVPVPEPDINDILPDDLVWKKFTIGEDDSLTRLFLQEGLTARDVYRVTHAKPKPNALLNLFPGQTLHFALHDTETGDLAIQALRLEIDPVNTLTLVATDMGFRSQIIKSEIAYQTRKSHGQIESSLFSAGKEAGLTDNLIMQLANIFNWDIDFALDIRQSDSFSLIYQQGIIDGKEVDDTKILAAEFINKGKSYRAIRYTNPAGETDYFTPKGNSMRKAFIRTPIDFARISSRFNLKRKHPILNKIRAHKGVDYAAARGTPIKATGRATIQSIGNQRGYGRTIVLKHAGKYTTLYAHMNGYAKGLRKGSRVKQGQIIGYVGSSGLATGPHLHYEFRINGVHRNPLTVKLPRSVPLNKKYRADFMSKATPLVVALDALANTALAEDQPR